METKKEILERLINYYGQGNKEAFGRHVGVSGAAVGQWLKKGSFPDARIIPLCPDFNPHYIRTGEGEPYAKAGIQTAIADHNSTAYNVAGDAAEVFNLQKEIVRLQAENSILKNEVEFLRTLLKRRRNP